MGLLCCVLATVTGSLFARIEWGSYWNWDPRETSITVLLLIYGAYFALRASVNDPERRARLRERCRETLPSGELVVTARAWAARGVAA